MQHDVYNDFDMRDLPVLAPAEPMVPWWYYELRMSSGNKSDTVENVIAEVEQKSSSNEVEQEFLPLISVKIPVNHFFG